MFSEIGRWSWAESGLAFLSGDRAQTYYFNFGFLLQFDYYCTEILTAMSFLPRATILMSGNSIGLGEEIRGLALPMSMLSKAL